MNNTNLRGPALTYVTDEELDRAAQERILNEFIACAGLHPLRVAFRLPTWTDAELRHLVEWYTNRVEKLRLQESMENPLVHDRPEVAARYHDCSLWLPWRNRDLVGVDDIGQVAISVHSVKEAHEAVSIGAGELIFGHVFTSESHPGEPGRGVAALSEVSDAVETYQNPPRVTAIGGIDEHTIPGIGHGRHHRVAAMRTISRSSNIAQTLDRIRSGWVAARINADLDESERTPFGNPSSIFF